MVYVSVWELFVTVTRTVGEEVGVWDSSRDSDGGEDAMVDGRFGGFSGRLGDVADMVSA